jgi:hypothetical protein
MDDAGIFLSQRTGGGGAAAPGATGERACVPAGSDDREHARGDGARGSGAAVESNFHVLRTSADGTVVTYGCGRYLDEIVQSWGGMQFRKRTVVLDSSRINTLLVIPL